MGIGVSKKNHILPYVMAGVLFVAACVLQQADDFVHSQHISKVMALAAQSLFFGILTYWTVSVVSRVSDKSGAYDNDYPDEFGHVDKAHKVQRAVRRDGGKICLVLLLHTAMSCACGASSDRSQNGEKKRKTAVRLLEFTVCACRFAYFACVYQRFARASVFFRERLGKRQQSI